MRLCLYYFKEVKEEMEKTTKNNNENNGGFNMFKTMKKQLKNEKGLTLIELLAVIVILAIIAAIAIPAIGNIITNSKYNAVKSDAINVINAAQLYYLDNPEKADGTDGAITEGATGITVEQLQTEKYLDNKGMIPLNATISREAPNAITTTTKITFSKDKSVEFVGATIENINADDKKGSSLEPNHKINGSPVSTPNDEDGK